MNARRFLRLASLLCLGLGFAAPARAVLVSDFGVTPPSSSVVVSSTTASGSTNSNLQWRNNRSIVLELTAPTLFSLTGFEILVQDGTNEAGSFTLSLVQLSTLNVAPTDAQLAAPLYTETGTLSAVTAGDFIQFTLGTPQTLAANAVYGLELAFTSASGTATLNFHQVAGGITSGTNSASLGSVYYGTNGSSLTSSTTQFVTYIQGTAVPEPHPAALLGGAGLLLAAMVRFRRARTA